MQINLREIYGKQHTTHLSEQLDMADIVKNEPSLHSAGPMRSDVDAGAESGNIVVHGHVEGELELVCSRCLTVFPSRLSFQFEEVFSNETREAEEGDKMDEENLINYVTEDKVDLVPYIEEHILLELPRFPVCEEHCKGLCPTCGRNRNTESCKCNDEKTDPRWSGLKDFFQP